MSNKCYSTNNEDFSHSDLSEAIEYHLDGDTKIGDIVAVWVGEAQAPCPLQFIPCIAENMQEAAYDSYGDYAEDAFDCTNEERDELQGQVGEVVRAWVEKHNTHPRFYDVINIKERRFVIRSLGGDFEEVEWDRSAEQVA